MSKKHDLEGAFARQLDERGLPTPCREYRFHPTRGWRFDFAWPRAQVAVEIQGGVWVGGKHGRGAGLVEGFKKINAAAVRGWWVLQGDASMIRDGSLLDDVEAALGFPNERHPEIAE